MFVRHVHRYLASGLLAALLLAPSIVAAQVNAAAPRGPQLEPSRLHHAALAAPAGPSVSEVRRTTRQGAMQSAYSPRTERILIGSGITLLGAGAAIGGDAGGFVMITGGFLALAAIVDRMR